MKKTCPLSSAAVAILLGAGPLAPTSASAQMVVTDPWTLAVDKATQFIQNQMNSMLGTISSQLGLSGPIGQLLGSNQYGSVTALLQQGFTQISNYQKAQVDAHSQLLDGSNLAMTRVQRDFRNAQIRDEHVVGSLNCAALDGGQAVVMGSTQSWTVAQSISAVTDARGEAGQNQPAYYGAAQATQANNQLHYSRYCSQPEAAAGLCSVSQNPNGDQRASTLFGSGTLNGQDGVNAANDYATMLLQPVVPGALRGDQLSSAIGADAAAKRRAYNARMSLAHAVTNYAIGVESPSVTLSSTQQQEMQNEGLTPAATASWLQALMLDANRRYASTNYAAQLASLPPNSVNREIATELAQTNYLLMQLYRVELMHATTAAAHMAENVEHDFQPAVQMPSPTVSN